MFGFSRGKTSARSSQPDVTFILDPEKSVYDTIVFLPLVERATDGSFWSQHLVVSLALVLVNIAMQASLVYIAGSTVLAEAQSDTAELMRPVKGAGYLNYADVHNLPAHGMEFNLSEHHVGVKHIEQAKGFLNRNGRLPFRHADRSDECPLIQPALCTELNGILSCQPSSLKAMQSWDNLDVDGDGLWTYEEAKADVRDLKCKFGLSAVAFFLDLRRQLMRADRNRHAAGGLWIHPDIEDRKAIPKAYYDWWKGGMQICMYMDSAVCASLLERGILDEALRPGASDDIHGLGSAYEFCLDHLKIGGWCDKAMFPDYQTYRSMHHDRCIAKGRNYHTFAKHNKYHDNDVMNMEVVSFKSVEKGENALRLSFALFFLIIMTLWISLLYKEAIAIWVHFALIVRFPTDRGEPFEQSAYASVYGSRDDQKIMMAMRTSHRIVVALVTFCRFSVLAFLSVAGTTFLSSNDDYIDLLFDALTLGFILEVDEILYETFTHMEVKQQVENIEDLEVPKLIRKYVIPKKIKDVLAFGFIVASAIAILFTSFQSFEERADGLECSCMKLGSHCLEAQIYNKAWWNNYWSVELPGARRGIAMLYAATQNSSIDNVKDELWGHVMVADDSEANDTRVAQESGNSTVSSANVTASTAQFVEQIGINGDDVPVREQESKRNRHRKAARFFHRAVHQLHERHGRRHLSKHRRHRLVY